MTTTTPAIGSVTRTAPDGTDRRKPGSPRRRAGWAGLVFIVPGFALYLLVIGWPAVQALLISLRDYKITPGAESPWIGLANYTRALHDPLLEAGGRLAIVSSTGVAKPTAKNAAYVAAKAAAEAWTLAVAHSFRNSEAAATVLRVMALGDRERFTPVATVASALAGLWDEPAAEVNGRITTL